MLLARDSRNPGQVEAGGWGHSGSKLYRPTGWEWWGQQRGVLSSQEGAWQCRLSPRPRWSLEDQLGGRWEVREEAACMRGVQGTLDVAQEHPELDSGARQ